MPSIRLLTAAALCAALAACSGLEVRSQHEPNVDFASFTTYAWASAIAANDLEAEVIDVVRPEVDRILASKGLSLVDRTEATVVVEEHLIVEQVTRANDPYYAFDRYTTYERGTLLLDLIDPGSSEVVWRGSATSKLDEKADDESRGERVRDAIGRMLDRYPPK